MKLRQYCRNTYTYINEKIRGVFSVLETRYKQAPMTYAVLLPDVNLLLTAIL